MKCLPDVNLLLAYAWKQHPDHEAVILWLDGLDGFVVCPITELGFVRISMSPAFRATHETANQVLAYICGRKGVIRIPCDFPARDIPNVTSCKDTTDAYLIALAKHHSVRLATLDHGILNKDWASEVAFNPLASDS